MMLAAHARPNTGAAYADGTRMRPTMFCICTGLF